jgi:hypothetical protein
LNDDERNDRLSRLESAVHDLEGAIQTLDGRLAGIERRMAAGSQAAPQPNVSVFGDEPAAVPRASGGSHDVVSVLSIVGRTCVALGGAYLLRALTDVSVLPPRTGVVLGLAYAAGWLVMADRAGAAGHRLSGTFHGIVASIIAFPLLWEAVTRLKFLGPGTSAMALTLVAGLLLAVAARARLHGLAWIAVLGTLPTAFALISSTGFVLPFAASLILLGVATLWLGYSLDWIVLRWPAAVAADVAVLALAARVSSGSWPDPGRQVIAVQLGLLSGYLASIVIRTLIRGRDVIPFEVVQSMAALAVGFGGAIYVAQATGSGVTALALINLAFGAGCYGVAFAFVARRQGLRRNFYFYTSLALILVLVSTHVLLEGPRLALAWGTLGVLSSWLARRVGRIALNLHGAVYAIAGAGVSGLLFSATDALVGPATTAWNPFSPASLIVLAAIGASWLIPMSPAAESWGVYSRLPRLCIVVALAWSLGGWIVAMLAPALAGTPGSGADAGIVATARTSVLAAAALALAWAGRLEWSREAGWLLYPVLVTGGLKLLVEDLPHSRPATLFLSLALYGGALIAAPRLAHRHAV